MQVCTAITQSHLPWARTLGASLREQHPEAPPLVVLVTDDVTGEVDDNHEPFDVRRPADLGIDRGELHLRAAMYLAVEFTGSMRGALLRTLLAATDGAPVLFLDADVYVVGRLDPLVEQASTAGIVLSPHLLKAGAETSELEGELLRAGAYNAGYLAVAGEAGRRFADWWARHLARHCVIDVASGLFLSQRWLDLAPSLFDVAMLRDPGSNVTPHNLAGRAVVRQDGGWTIDGEVLRFLHVSGRFNPRATNWPELSSQPAVTELCQQYAERLIAAGHRSPPQPAYRYESSASGLRIDPWIRRLCRAMVLTGDHFPDPFDSATAESFTAWLAEDIATSGPPVSRWALALRDWRTDLRAVFDRVPGPHSGRYLRWLAEQDDHPVPPRFWPSPVDLPEETELEAMRNKWQARLDDAMREVTAARRERDAARRANDRIQSSFVVRATRLPRRAWYKARGLASGR